MRRCALTNSTCLGSRVTGQGAFAADYTCPVTGSVNREVRLFPRQSRYNRHKDMSIKMVVVALIGGAFALVANLVAFTMIDQINRKVPEGLKVHWLFWGTEIKKKHRAIYPDSKLVSVINGLTWPMAACFLVLCWFVLH